MGWTVRSCRDALLSDFVAVDAKSVEQTPGVHLEEKNKNIERSGGQKWKLSVQPCMVDLDEEGWLLGTGSAITEKSGAEMLALFRDLPSCSGVINLERDLKAKGETKWDVLV